MEACFPERDLERTERASERAHGLCPAPAALTVEALEVPPSLSDPESVFSQAAVMQLFGNGEGEAAKQQDTWTQPQRS